MAADVWSKSDVRLSSRQPGRRDNSNVIFLLIAAFPLQGAGVVHAEDFHRFSMRCSIVGIQKNAEGQTTPLKTSANFVFNNRQKVEFQDESFEPDHWALRYVTQFSEQLIRVGWGDPPDPHAFLKIEFDRIQHKITGQLRYDAGFGMLPRSANYAGTCEPEIQITGPCVWHVNIVDKCEG